MITARAFAGRRYAVLGLARSGLATCAALIASGAGVTAWDEREAARDAAITGTMMQRAQALRERIEIADRVQQRVPAYLDYGWTIGRVNVTTTRTWSLQEGSPLAALRQVAKVHGGDLVFDNAARTVSLLTFAGRRDGLTFFYGRGVTGAKRVEDTTTLVTRLYARNAEGLTIADVNGGLPYVEDFTWTSEVRTAVYDFASGTNPFTMLAMATATLGRRSKPKVSYEVEVVDLSAWSAQALDRFACGDEVKVVDTELGIDTTDRIVRLEYDLLRPWASKITLSEKLRELGDSSGPDGGTLTTGADIDTREELDRWS